LDIKLAGCLIGQFAEHLPGGGGSLIPVGLDRAGYKSQCPLRFVVFGY